MAYEGAEQVVAAVLDHLQSNLNTAIATLNTEKGDEPQLQDIASWKDSEQQQVPADPAVFVFAETARALGGETSSRLRVEYPVEIITVVREGNEDLVRKRLQRHVQVLLRVLLAARNTGAIVYNSERFQIFWQEPLAVFVPVYVDPQGNYMQDASVRILIRVTEDI